jgi:hypothetical protein
MVKKTRKPKIIDNTEKLTALLKEYRVMYIKLKNGDELVTWVAPFGTGAKLVLLDIEQTNSTRAKTELDKETILQTLEEEHKDRTELFLTKGNHAEANLVELKYPTKLTYSTNYNENLARQTPVVYLTPWISTAISSTQLFPLAKNDIISMTTIEPELMALYVKTVQRIVLSITVSKQMDKFTDSDDSDPEWNEEANTVRKIVVAGDGKNTTTANNTSIPYVVWGDSKKTVH